MWASEGGPEGSVCFQGELRTYLPEE